MTAKPTSSGRMNMTQKNDNPKINENKTKIFCKKNDDLNEDLNEKIKNQLSIAWLAKIDLRLGLAWLDIWTQSVGRFVRRL